MFPIEATTEAVSNSTKAIGAFATIIATTTGMAASNGNEILCMHASKILSYHTHSVIEGASPILSRPYFLHY